MWIFLLQFYDLPEVVSDSVSVDSWIYKLWVCFLPVYARIVLSIISYSYFFIFCVAEGLKAVLSCTRRNAEHFLAVVKEVHRSFTCSVVKELGAFVGGVYMFTPCLCWFSLGFFPQSKGMHNRLRETLMVRRISFYCPEKRNLKCSKTFTLRISVIIFLN